VHPGPEQGQYQVFLGSGEAYVGAVDVQEKVPSLSQQPSETPHFKEPQTI